jgi:hypothetical protein
MFKLFEPNSRYQNQSGQILLFALLILLVGLASGISIYIDTLGRVEITGTRERSSAAFSAAEAVIEEQLLLDYVDIQGKSEVQYGENEIPVTIEVVENTTGNVEFSGVVMNDTVTVLLEGVGSGNITVNWVAGSGQCKLGEKVGLWVEHWYDQGGVKVERNFTSCSGSYSQAVTANSILLRIRPLFNSTDITVSNGTATLPAQVKTIKAVARTPLAEGDVETRAVEVDRHVSSLPSIFDYVLFSNGAIIK